MALLEKMTELCSFLVTKLENNRTDLGLQDVFYGDQERIPRTPSACVEAGEKTNELNGLPRRVLTVHEVYIILYHNPLKNATTIRKEVDTLAENVETLIHADPNFKDADDNDQVIDSLVTSIESGYQYKQNSIYRASRLTISATVQRQLPSSF